MATLNGAKALGLEADIGSLAAGKLADLAAVRISDVETLPIYDAVSHLVNAVSREHVTDVWVGGARLLDSGELQGIDAAAIAARARAWQQRLA
jgi:5-methylthioadenosine/S-adenosylhomocysteine deaminase